VEAKPLALDDIALRRHRRLLVLSREDEAALGTAHGLQNLERLTRVEDFAGVANVDVSGSVSELIGPLLGGDRGNGHNLPFAGSRNMPDQIILVETLHDDHDRAGPLVVEPGEQGIVEGLVHTPALSLGPSI